MPVLKTYKNGVWEPVSGMSEHTHTKNDITDLQEKVYTQPDEPVDAPVGAVWVDTDEDVGFGGGSGGADWNASEGEPGHVLNRPLYEGIGMGVLCSGTANVKRDYSSTLIRQPVEIVIGKKYEVTVNGVTYTNLVAYDEIYEGEHYATIGAPLLEDGSDYDHSEIPWVISNDPNGLSFYHIAAGEYEVVLKGETQVVYRLDEKYLPASAKTYVFKLSDLIFVSPGGVTRLTTSYDELAEILWSGGTVIVEFTTGERVKVFSHMYLDGDFTFTFPVMTTGEEKYLSYMSLVFTPITWTPPTT